MGVYIKGMEMPKPKLTDPATVYYAYILVRPNGHAVIVVDNEAGLGSTDSTEYPLVPVPPHGRLIDADALIESFDPSDFWNPDAEDNCFAAVHVVNCAPTIIAEEGE